MTRPQGHRRRDLSHPSLRSWLDALPAGGGRSAAFDTQVSGPFGKGAPTIAEALEGKGYARLAEPQGFVVKGSRARCATASSSGPAPGARSSRVSWAERRERRGRRRGGVSPAADSPRSVAAIKSR